jgi:hypothetical protein
MSRAEGAPRIAERVAAVDWERAAAELDAVGHARIPGLLRAQECSALAALWDDAARFRKRVDLAQHRFGEGGAYQYFAYPLPDLVAELRRALYGPLARIANAWRARLEPSAVAQRRPRGSQDAGRRTAARFPPTLERFLAHCRRQGQTRPTPLLLRYGAGGYNRLHQDLYGAVSFPLQATVLLSRPGRDFMGGEFLLLEQRPREQARAEAVSLEQGEAIVFPNHARPVRGRRGWGRVQVRHGVARVRSGDRATLGLIFHDAR